MDGSVYGPLGAEQGGIEIESCIQEEVPQLVQERNLEFDSDGGYFTTESDVMGRCGGSSSVTQHRLRPPSAPGRPNSVPAHACDANFSRRSPSAAIAAEGSAFGCTARP